MSVTTQGRWTVTVRGAQAPGRGAPQNGTICLQLDITVCNTMNQALTFSTHQFALYDPQTNAITTTCSVDAPRLKDASLAPGTMLEGVIAYSVPANVQQFYLAFQPDPQNAANVASFFWSSQAAQVQGNHQPEETASASREADTP